MALVDLSHTIEHGMITYKGLPAPLICDFLSRDASRQLYAKGKDLLELPLAAVASPSPAPAAEPEFVPENDYPFFGGELPEGY